MEIAGLVYIRNLTCEYDHPQHNRGGWLPYECTEFVRPENGCTWGDCTRPGTARIEKGSGRGRLVCERCMHVARVCGIAR